MRARRVSPGTGRRRVIERHLIEDDIDARHRDAENSEMVRRIPSEKPQIARGERWNDSGVGERPLDHGGVRPSNLREDETRIVAWAGRGWAAVDEP